MAVRLQARRLDALDERLEAARPKRVHGVPEWHWQTWQAAARAAAELPSAEWEAWWATVGTAGALSGATAASTLSGTAEGVRR